MAALFRLKLAGQRGYVITDQTGRRWYRHDLEQPGDGFVLVECDEGHVYAVDRDTLRADQVPECPRCAAGERVAA